MKGAVRSDCRPGTLLVDVPGVEELASKAYLFRALGDPQRLQIVLALREHELCVCEIVKVLGASQPTVSRQLATLAREGVVTSRHDGRWVFYSLTDSAREQYLPLVSDALQESLAPTR